MRCIFLPKRMRLIPYEEENLNQADDENAERWRAEPDTIFDRVLASPRNDVLHQQVQAVADKRSVHGLAEFLRIESPVAVGVVSLEDRLSQRLGVDMVILGKLLQQLSHLFRVDVTIVVPIKLKRN